MNNIQFFINLIFTKIFSLVSEQNFFTPFKMIREKRITKQPIHFLPTYPEPKKYPSKTPKKHRKLKRCEYKMVPLPVKLQFSLKIMCLSSVYFGFTWAFSHDIRTLYWWKKMAIYQQMCQFLPNSKISEALKLNRIKISN